MAIIKRTPRPGELVRGATAGDLAAFGPDGELVDSGLATEDVPEWPTGGNVDDVLTKGADGPVWAPPAGGLPDPATGNINKIMIINPSNEWRLSRAGLTEYHFTLGVDVVIDSETVSLILDGVLESSTERSMTSISDLSALLGDSIYTQLHPLPLAAKTIAGTGVVWVIIDPEIYREGSAIYLRYDVLKIDTTAGTVTTFLNQTTTITTGTVTSQKASLRIALIS